MQFPKITIITPSFNQGQYIEQTINSILSQNYPNLEYIIIDGGSTDDTVDIIKKYEDKITYWVSEPDNGQAHAINKGLNKATGELVNWINSDDYLEDGALLTLAEAYEQNQTAFAFCGYTRCFWDEDNSTSHSYRMGLKKDTTSTLLSIEMNQPGTFLKREAVEKVGGVNESLRYVFDNELWMRLLCSYGQENVVVLSETIAHFRQHGGSKSFGEGFEHFHFEQNNILAVLLDQTEASPLLSELFRQEQKTNHYKSAPWVLKHMNVSKFHAWFSNKYLVTMFNDGKIEETRYHLKQAIKHSTFKSKRKNLSVVKKLLFS